MKINELITELTIAEERFGDIECLVEVMIDDCACMMSVDELSYEDRDHFGESIALIG